MRELRICWIRWRMITTKREMSRSRNCNWSAKGLFSGRKPPGKSKLYAAAIRFSKNYWLLLQARKSSCSRKASPNSLKIWPKPDNKKINENKWNWRPNKWKKWGKRPSKTNKKWWWKNLPIKSKSKLQPPLPSSPNPIPKLPSPKLNPKSPKKPHKNQP